MQLGEFGGLAPNDPEGVVGWTSSVPVKTVQVTIDANNTTAFDNLMFVQ